jgi:hypothetical protein
MLTHEIALQKYLSHDYRIRYLGDGVDPTCVPEQNTVFALESGRQVGHGLVCDPPHRPLPFHTEEQVFAHRSALGLERPMLVFHTKPQKEPEPEAAAGNALDVGTFFEVARYLGE